MKMHSLYSFVICALIAAMLSGIVANTAYAKVSDEGTKTLPDVKILLEGFPSNTEIDYTILSGSKIILQGVDDTNPDGTLTISARSLSVQDQENIIYDFKIFDNGNYVDLLLRQNINTGKISVSGKGLEQFSDIGIITAGKNIRTKTDWSGNFNESGIAGNSKIFFSQFLHLAEWRVCIA